MLKPVALIGGSGFIGTRLAGRLLAAGRPIRIIDIAPSRFYPQHRTAGDVRDRGTFAAALKDCSAIVNLAAQHKDNFLAFIQKGLTADRLEVRQACLAGLKHVKREQRLQQLRHEVAANKFADLRRLALEQIVEGEGKAAVADLVKALKDKDVGVRVAAVEALVTVGKGNEEAVQAVRDAINDVDEQVRVRAAAGVYRMAQ